ncbi:hypothetical protein EVAR_56190_1 [Eumeta japonica]|uniref:Uncharacterized protein n=1 Tax=Eumeta variegata TaxID=151549 RepID=A0A4C1ZW17_EUMVA|nr:hypothetical protein EVAR_56190_1 [Eumeta japonica]
MQNGKCIISAARLTVVGEARPRQAHDEVALDVVGQHELAAHRALDPCNETTAPLTTCRTTFDSAPRRLAAGAPHHRVTPEGRDDDIHRLLTNVFRFTEFNIYGVRDHPFEAS